MSLHSSLKNWIGDYKNFYTNLRDGNISYNKEGAFKVDKSIGVIILVSLPFKKFASSIKLINFDGFLSNLS